MIINRNTTLYSTTNKRIRWMTMSYRCIFFIFRSTALIPFRRQTNSSNLNSNRKRITFVIVSNILLLLILLSFVISSILTDNDAMAWRPKLIVTIIAFIHRWILSQRLDSMQELFKKVEKISRESNNSHKRNISMWINILGLLSSLMLIGTIVFNAMAYYTQGHVDNLTFGYSIKYHVLELLLFVMYIIIHLLLLLIPLNAFAVYYTLICLMIESALVNISKSMDNILSNNINNLILSYKAVKILVEDLESLTSSLMLTSTLYNASTMYFVVTAWLNLQQQIISSENIAIVFLFGAIFWSFVSMGVSGCLVHEASLDISNKARDMIRVGRKQTLAEKQLMHVTENGMHLTVWKIMPIRRSFLIATMGTILTYCILLLNLQAYNSD